jgi:hypothetical protein
MVDPRRRLLLYELELQCGFVLSAYGAATAALQRKDRDGFWYSVQALLGAAAHIHDFLAPDLALRRALGVPDDSPLLRPELGAAGEVAGAWSAWVSQSRGPLRLTNFGPHGISDVNRGLFARFIDVDRSLCILFGNPYDIAELMASVAVVNQQIKEEVRRLQQVV